MKIDKKDILVHLSFLVITLAFFFRLLDGAEVLAFKDLSRYFYPLRYLMVQMVKSGILPLWNPYIFCGMPFLATLQVGFFYPPIIIHYLLPFDLAFNYYTILHYYLAAVFMYWLMRHYQLNRAGAFMSGLVFAFSGYLMSVNNMNTTLTSVVWLPLVLLWWDRLLGGKSKIQNPKSQPGMPVGHLLYNVRSTQNWDLGFGNWDFILSIVCLALMFLGGEPTIIYITGWLLLGYTLFLYPDRLRNIGKLALAFAVAALLLSAQLLPFLELLWHSDRGMLSNFETIARWSLPPREIVNFILPFFFGNPLRAGNYSEVILGSDVQNWLLSPYAGFTVIFLAVLGLLKKDKLQWFFAGAGALALVLALGRYTPIYIVFYKLVPGISFIRYPVKYLFVVNLMLAALAGWGAESLGRLTAAKKADLMFKVLAGLGALLLGLSTSLQLFRVQAFSWLHYFYPKGLPRFFMEELWVTYSFNIKSLGNAAIFILAAALIIFLAEKKLLSRGIFYFILLALVVIDLFAVNSSLVYPVIQEAYHLVPDNLKILTADQGLFRYDYSPQAEKSSRILSGLDYKQALYENLDRLTANRLVPFGLFDFNGYESIVLKGYRELTQKYPQGMPLKMTSELNIKYAATENPVNYPGYKLLRKATYFYGQMYLYRNNNYLPRAYIEGRKDPCKIIKYSPSEVEIRATLKAPGELFLSDTHYPGWQAKVDGRDAKIERSKGFFRSVKLDKGEHTVRFVYDPPSFKLGMLLSGLTILGLAAAGLSQKSS